MHHRLGKFAAAVSDDSENTKRIRGQPLLRIEAALTKNLRSTLNILDFADLTPAFQARVEREGLPIHGR
jgi:hypothetical protein